LANGQLLPGVYALGSICCGVEHLLPWQWVEQCSALLTPQVHAACCQAGLCS
jgi:hypothetical protein